MLLILLRLPELCKLAGALMWTDVLNIAPRVAPEKSGHLHRLGAIVLLEALEGEAEKWAR